MIDVNLTCLHTIQVREKNLNYYLRDDAKGFCWHDGYRPVLNVVMTPYRVICPDCTYGRFFGADDGHAKSSARYHNRTHPGHRAFVYRDQLDHNGKPTRRKTVIARCMSTVESDTVLTYEAPPPF